MARESIPTWFYSLVVARNGDRFLVVREVKHGQLWYLPAGRAEPGESLEEAARRETLEETGVDVTLEGILKIQHTPDRRGARVRAIFVARPAGDPTPRTTPNEHSLEARWVTKQELEKLPLRGPEVIALFDWVAGGAPIYPLDLIGREY
jgi:ADP-ribose pyrophosphatase YjhB (NUDIX family)